MIKVNQPTGCGERLELQLKAKALGLIPSPDNKIKRVCIKNFALKISKRIQHLFAPDGRLPSAAHDIHV